MSPSSRSGLWRVQRDLGTFDTPHAAGNGASPSAARSMRALDILAVALGLVILTAGTISCAIAGAWAAMVTMLPIGLSLVLVPGRDDGAGAPAKGR